MSENPEHFMSEDDLALERSYFSLIKELRIKNSSKYEDLANRLSPGGEELFELQNVTYKISVSKNGCGYSYRENDGINFQSLGWTKLTQIPSERISVIADTLAECEARAQINC